MNRGNVPIGNGAEDGLGPQTIQAEATAVSKQTTETLMAGERIMEALDLGDKERETFHQYEEAMAKLPEDDPMRLQPPARNPILAAYDLEPEAYVLRVVEKVPSAALHDALLVLPFGQVISLMYYLTAWAQKVRSSSQVSHTAEVDPVYLGLEHPSRVQDYVLSFESTSPPDCSKSYHEDNFNTSTETSPSRTPTSERHDGIQPCCFAVHEKKERG